MHKVRNLSDKCGTSSIAASFDPVFLEALPEIALRNRPWRRVVSLMPSRAEGGKWG